MNAGCCDVVSTFDHLSLLSVLYSPQCNVAIKGLKVLFITY